MEHFFIKKLLLKGVAKDYEYGFQPGLNIIAGPIFTGKTSLLELIDYCLGAGSHPQHLEIQRKVRVALLEVSIGADSFVIERPLFSTEQKATIHVCSLSALPVQHDEMPVRTRQIPGQESIGSYLLKRLGLFNIFLKEAPTKAASAVDMMSFRDLMWFCYLEHERLDNKELLFESLFVKRIKLQQVFDVIFEVHANEVSNLSYQLKDLEAMFAKVDTEIRTLRAFLVERSVPSRQQLEDVLTDLSKSQNEMEIRLSGLTHTLKGQSDVAEELRTELSQGEDEVKRLQVAKRDREKLLKRLLPLRGQYSEDVKKLQFLQETKTIFDPLGLVRCPCCLQTFQSEEPQSRCGLCGAQIQRQPEESFDIEREIRIVETKLRELNTYIHETDGELIGINEALKTQDEAAAQLRAKIDEAMQQYVSPYISERDAVVGGLNRIRQQIHEAKSTLDLHKGIEQRMENRTKLAEEMEFKTAQIEAVRTKSKDRDEIIERISDRFGKILSAAAFPKLEKPLIREDLTPVVRELEYRHIGSSGGMTLLSVSWFLSIFENAVELNARHPGFIMIDSPQKNIGLRAQTNEPDFRDTRIVDGLYGHIMRKATEFGPAAQWLVVDNEPPAIADNYVVVRFTGDKNKPPYGLIDDEVE